VPMFSKAICWASREFRQCDNCLPIVGEICCQSQPIMGLGRFLQRHLLSLRRESEPVKKTKNQKKNKNRHISKTARIPIGKLIMNTIEIKFKRFSLVFPNDNYHIQIQHSDLTYHTTLWDVVRQLSVLWIEYSITRYFFLFNLNVE